MPQAQAITTRLNIETGFDGGSAIENASKLMLSLGNAANETAASFVDQAKQSVNLDGTVKKLQSSFQTVTSTLGTKTKSALTQVSTGFTNLSSTSTRASQTIGVDLPKAERKAIEANLSLKKSLGGVIQNIGKIGSSIKENLTSNFGNFTKQIATTFIPGMDAATNVLVGFASTGIDKASKALGKRLTPELIEKLTPALTKVSSVIGVSLLPQIEKLAGSIVGKLIPGAGGVADIVTDLSGALGGVLLPKIGGVAQSVVGLAGHLGNALIPGFGLLTGAVANAAAPAIEQLTVFALKNLGNALKNILKLGLEPLVKYILNNVVGNALGKLGAALKELGIRGFNALSTAIKTGLLTTLRALGNVTQTIVTKALNGLGTVLKGTLLVSLGLASRAFTTLNNQLGTIFFNAISRVGNFLRTSFNTAITATGSVLANLLSPQVRGLAKTLQNNFNNALFAVRTNLIKLGNAAKVAGSLIRDQLAKPINEVRALHEEGAAVLGRYNTKVDELSDEARTALTPLVAFFQAFTEGGREILNTQEVLERVSFAPLVDDISKVNDEFRQLNLFGPPAAKEIGLVGKEMQQLGLFATGTVTPIKEFNKEINQQNYREFVDDISKVNDEFRQLSVFGPPAAKEIGLVGKELQQLSLFATTATPAVTQLRQELSVNNYSALADDISKVNNELRQLNLFGPPAAKEIGIAGKEIEQLSLFSEAASNEVRDLNKVIQVQNYTQFADDISKVNDEMRQLSIFGPPAAKEIGIVGKELQQLSLFAETAATEVRDLNKVIEVQNYTQFTDDISKVNDEFRQLNMFGPPAAKEIGLVGKELQQLGLFADAAATEVKTLTAALEVQNYTQFADDISKVNNEMRQLSVFGPPAAKDIGLVGKELIS